MFLLLKYTNHVYSKKEAVFLKCSFSSNSELFCSSVISNVLDNCVLKGELLSTLYHQVDHIKFYTLVQYN